MKANQLLRIPIGICITAGAVIAFVPRSATSLHRSEIFSANNNDLTSLLGTTKYDIETGKQFAKTVSSKIPDTVITNPVPAIETPADVIKTYSSLKSSPLLEVTRVEDDKVFPLGSFIKSTLTVENTGSAPADSSSWDTAVANFGILTDNFLGLFGTTIPLGSDTAPAYLKNVPEEVKPWLVLITGTTLAIIGSSASKKASLIVTTDNTKSIQASSDAIDSLSNELGSLQSRMKLLEATGLNLDSKLKNATLKLTQKELDISKEKFKAADVSLNLGREIELLKQNLKQNNDKVISLDLELAEARVECHKLVKELKISKDKKIAAQKKANEKEAQLKSEKEAVRIKVEKGALEKEGARLKDEKEMKGKSLTNNKELPISSFDKTETEKTVLTKKKTVRKAAKKFSTAVKIDELPTSDDAPATKIAPKTKSSRAKEKAATTKAKKETIDRRKTVESKDAGSNNESESEPIFASHTKVEEKVELTILSKSALSRKTVKQLREFLESKGVSITGNDGKPLKKNGLLEAVRSL